jgi:hypothetical protein
MSAARNRLSLEFRDRTVRMAGSGTLPSFSGWPADAGFCQIRTLMSRPPRPRSVAATGPVVE